ncbi:hypothetical protein AB6D84_04570 [Vibrio lentus]
MTTNKHPRIFTVLFSIIAGLFIGSTTGIIPIRSPEFTALITLIGVFSAATLAAYPLFNRSESKNSYLIPILLGGIALVLLATLFINLLPPDSIHVELGSEQQTNQTVQASMTQVESYFDTNAFGSWAAWFAAFGTIGTLVFLVKQHNQMRKEQKAQQNELISERLKREEHERKQQDMWQEQRELLKVQKLQIHRELFFEKLSEIELSANTHFEFYEKGILHDSLFNMRGINLSIDNTNFVVKKLHTAFSRINTILDSPPSEQTIKELLNILHDIYRFYLYADPGEPKTPGDLSGTSCIKKHRFPVINVFDIDNQISALLRSYDIICSFGNHNVDVFANCSPVTKEFKLELIRFAVSRNSGNSSYRLVKDKHERLNFVVFLYDIIVNDKNYNTTWPSIHKLEQLFNSSQDLSSNLHSDFKFQALLTTCKRDLYEAGEMNEQNDRIIDQLRDIITSL